MPLNKRTLHILNKLAGLFLSLMILLCSAPAASAENSPPVLSADINADKTPALNTVNIDLPTDYYSTLKVTGVSGNVKWGSADSEIVSVEPMSKNTADIIGRKPGTAYIFAVADGKILRCRVNVADGFIYAGSTDEEMHPGEQTKVRVSVLGSKDISIKYAGKRFFVPSWGKWSGNSIDIDIKGVSPGSGSLDLYTADKPDKPACSVNITVTDRPDSGSPWSAKTSRNNGFDDKAGNAVPEPVIPDEGKVFPLNERVTDTYESLCGEMDKIIADYPYECAVLLYSPQEGSLYSHNADRYMPGGSTVKLPYAYYCCLEMEKGNHSLDEMIVYRPKHKADGAGVIRNYAYGTKWSIRTLLDYSMRYSDNTAYYMLISVFGKEGFNKMADSRGYKVRLGRTNYPNVDSEFLSTSMLRLHEKVISSDNDCWQTVWTGLLESEYSEVRKEINCCDTAVKFGLLREYYSEVCYIDSPSPYVLIIMSKTNNSGEHRDGDEKFFRSVARCADKINKVRTE
ncbi:MAG: class A beta-lactamase-related serine hydrolase [Oscillospiraceae bacterium]|nr:class A beta-lactamase-related serine hydrolase [Oscillospiraceae bacterium]